MLAAIAVAHDDEESFVVLNSSNNVLINPHVALLVVDLLGVTSSGVDGIDVHASLSPVFPYNHEGGRGLLAKLDIGYIVILVERQLNL